MEVFHYLYLTLINRQGMKNLFSTITIIFSFSICLPLPHPSHQHTHPPSSPSLSCLGLSLFYVPEERGACLPVYFFTMS